MQGFPPFDRPSTASLEVSSPSMSEDNPICNSQMDSQGNVYYANLFNGQINLDREFNLESLEQVGQSFPISPQIGSTINKPASSENCNIEKDSMLISSWINVSLDVMRGNEQKSKAYWLRVWEYFHTCKTFDSQRNHGSLMNHWSTVQLNTSKCCGCFAQVKRMNRSGTTKKDTVHDSKKCSTNCMDHRANLNIVGIS